MDAQSPPMELTPFLHSTHQICLRLCSGSKKHRKIFSQHPLTLTITQCAHFWAGQRGTTLRDVHIRSVAAQLQPGLHSQAAVYSSVQEPKGSALGAVHLESFISQRFAPSPSKARELSQEIDLPM